MSAIRKEIVRVTQLEQEMARPISIWHPLPVVSDLDDDEYDGLSKETARRGPTMPSTSSMTMLKFPLPSRKIEGEGTGMNREQEGEEMPNSRRAKAAVSRHTSSSKTKDSGLKPRPGRRRAKTKAKDRTKARHHCGKAKSNGSPKAGGLGLRPGTSRRIRHHHATIW